jgi:hypothetical protein
MKKNPFQTKLGRTAATTGIVILGMVFIFAIKVFAFNGPAQNPAGGAGAVGSDASNNVAVGTATPISGTKLTVVGASNDNSTYAVKILSNNQTPLFLLRDDGSISIATGTSIAGTTIIGGNLTGAGTLTSQGSGGTITSGNVSAGSFGSNTGGGNYTFPGSVSLNGNLVFSADQTTYFIKGPTYGGAIRIRDNGGTASDRNVQFGVINNLGTWSSYMDIEDGGNVGIGTTAPGYPLMVAGTISASGAGGFNSATYVANSRNPIWRFGNADGYGISYFQGSAGVGGLDTIGFHFGTATAAASILQLNQNGTITMNGNVGIGNGSPSYKLDVAGQIRSSSGGYVFPDGTTQVTAASASTIANTATSADLNTLTTSGFYRLNGSNANAPGDYGQLLTMHGAADTITQLYGEYSNGLLYTRSGNPSNVGGNGSWSSWHTILDSSNYSGYVSAGTMNAGNVSAGTFGSNTGGGNYTFPSALTVNGGLYSSNFQAYNNGTNASVVSFAAGSGGDYWTWYINSQTSGSGVGTRILSLYAYPYDSTNGCCHQVMRLSPLDSSVAFSGVVSAAQFTGSGAGLTGTAGSLSIGGSAGSLSNMNISQFSNNSGYIADGGTFNSGPFTNDWFRVNGGGGIYWQAYGGGWQMTDTTWMRTYNGKGVYSSGGLYVAGATTLVGKLTVGTIDPVYAINGQNYATYSTAMTGVKEETTGLLELTCAKGERGTCSNTIDFNNLSQGSDLWLFGKATNLPKNLSSAIVILTPSFDGKAWYTKDLSAGTVTVYGDQAGEVSYRLTAPRFDSEQWPNTAEADEKPNFTIK